MSRKPLWLIEPYVGYGAHSMRHLHQLLPEMEERGYLPVWVGEQMIPVPQVPPERLLAVLTPVEPYLRLGREDRVRVRREVYGNLLDLAPRQSRILQLTCMEEDLRAWLQLLLDPSRTAWWGAHDIRLILHSPYNIFTSLAWLTKSERRLLEDLGETLTLAFYSEFQTLAVRELFPEIRSMTFMLPCHDRAFRERSASVETDGWASHLGLYHLAKGYHHILSLCDSGLNVHQYLQFFPLDGRSLSYHQALMHRACAQTRVYPGKLDADGYRDVLNRTGLGLLPYHQGQYAAQASGVLEEYLMLGLPVVVPDHTWMAWFWGAMKGGGGLFDESDPEAFSRAVRDASQAQAVREGRRERAEHVYQYRRFEIFESLLERVDEGGTEGPLEQEALAWDKEHRVRTAAMSRFWREVSQEAGTRGDACMGGYAVGIARKLDPHYLENRLLRTPGCEERGWSWEEVIPLVRGPRDIDLLLGAGRGPRPGGRMRRLLIEAMVRYRYGDLVPMDRLGDVRRVLGTVPSWLLHVPEKPVRNDAREGWLLLGVYWMAGRTDDAAALLRDLDAGEDLEDRVNIWLWRRELWGEERPEALLWRDSVLGEGRDPALYWYRMASFLKGVRPERGVIWFRDWLKLFPDSPLRAGALFHLGEALLGPEPEEAVRCLEDCLRLNPAHQAASDLLAMARGKVGVG